MTDGIRDELRELLYDSAPPADVDGEALFARTFASPEGAGADLLPADGLFDLPADDADETGSDEAGVDGVAFEEPGDGGGAQVEPDLDGAPVADDPVADDPVADDPVSDDPAPDDPADLPGGFELPGAGW